MDTQILTKIRENKHAVASICAILLLTILAVYTRASPATDGLMAGHLLSMDDPYYHYKQTDRLYENGDIADRDYSIYPPDGRETPERFPYYYNAELAHITGNPVRDIIILYPIFLAIIGAIAMYALMRELTGSWVSGIIGGFLFITMPSILYKSVAGAVEEDFMGMVLG